MAQKLTETDRWLFDNFIGRMGGLGKFHKREVNVRIRRVMLLKSHVTALIAALLIVWIVQLFYDRWSLSVVQDSPVQYGVPELLTTGDVYPGSFIIQKVPTRRLEVCPGDVYRTWINSDGQALIGATIPIAGYVTNDGQWHDYSLKLRVPSEVEGKWVDLRQTIVSNCNGRATKPAIVPPLRINLAQPFVD